MSPRKKNKKGIEYLGHTIKPIPATPKNNPPWYCEVYQDKITPDNLLYVTSDFISRALAISKAKAQIKIDSALITMEVLT